MSEWREASSHVSVQGQVGLTARSRGVQKRAFSEKCRVRTVESTEMVSVKLVDAIGTVSLTDGFDTTGNGT